MKSPLLALVAIAALCVGVAALVVWWPVASVDGDAHAGPSGVEESDEPRSVKNVEADTVTTPAGMVAADSTDPAREDRQDPTIANDGAADAGAGSPADSSLPAPRTIPRDANPQTRSVAEALQTGEHPERLSPNFMPAAFNAEAWETDPAYRKRYLATIEPGRVWQALPPGDGTPAIERVSSGSVELPAGGSVTLQVRAAPKAPITWNSFDSGMIQETLLPTATVVAGADGLGSVTFEATAGTVGRTRILAASPLSSGQAVFHIYVENPDDAVLAAEDPEESP